MDVRPPNYEEAQPMNNLNLSEVLMIIEREELPTYDVEVLEFDEVIELGE